MIPFIRTRRTTFRTLAALLLLALVSLGCELSGGGDVPLPPADPPTLEPRPVEPPFTVFFTQPRSPEADERRGGPDEPLIEAINQARDSVDVAVLNFNLQFVADALDHAHDRGLRVRVVLDSDALDNRVPQWLKSQSIPVRGDQREALMHNKFIIIDGQEVWTGSMNLTVSGAYDDYNHLVRIRDAQVAEDYQREFDEMFERGEFGPESRADTPYPQLTVQGIPVEVYFAPEDGVARRLVTLVRGAQQSVDFLAYSFTRDDLADAMIERSRAGVSVRGVFESEQVDSNRGTEFNRLRQAQIPVFRDQLPGQMHHKVLIIDRRVVVFGSYNFSINAETQNDENVMIVTDPDLAAQFLAEFESIYRQSQN